MRLAKLPAPINHPMIGMDGLVTRPWVEYFQRLAIAADSDLSGLMLKSVYDPTGAGVVDDSQALDGKSLAYVLDLGNSTGSLALRKLYIDTYRVTVTGNIEDPGLYLCNATSAAIVLTLPDAADFPGSSFLVKKTDGTANTVTIAPSGSQTINGGASVILSTSGQSTHVISDGANWNTF